MKALGYLRVPTDKQVDTGASIEAQRSRIRQYCELYGFTLTRVVEDAGESASTLGRPGLAGALRALEAGEADALVVDKLDRLTRSVRDLDLLINGLFQRFTLVSVAEQIDTSSPSGRLVLNVLASVSQWERKR